jgi:hypothetical protein
MINSDTDFTRFLQGYESSAFQEIPDRYQTRSFFITIKKPLLVSIPSQYHLAHILPFIHLF